MVATTNTNESPEDGGRDIKDRTNLGKIVISDIVIIMLSGQPDNPEN